MPKLEDREAQQAELNRLNSWRRAGRLPEFAAFRTDAGLGIAWEEGADPLYVIEGGAGGLLYRDRISQIFVDEGAITITTAKALWVPARTILPANYFTPGKIVKLTAFGKMTTGATPGNLTPSLGYGAGDNPTPLVSGVARAAIANVTNIAWRLEGYMECRTLGASGTARMWGQFTADLALQLSTAQPNLIPGATPADSTVDTTVGTNAFTGQMARSGSTTETMTTTFLLFEAVN